MANSKRQPVTMADVAEAAGVSRMTVSRALREHSSVSKATRQRILKVVRQMNYVPDQMAGSLSSKRSGFIAALVPSINNVHYGRMVESLTEALESRSLQVLLGNTDYSRDREEALVESMLSRRPEAIALTSDGHSKRTMALLKQAQIPVVQLWETSQKPIDHSIGFSNEAVAQKMTQELIALGYRNIAFLCETNDEWTRGAARRAGFKKAMEMAGLSSHRMIRFGEPPMSIQNGHFVGSNLEHFYDDIDCIFCVSDAPAYGLLSAFRERGIRVPDDVGIAGFGDFEVSRYCSPTISTVRFDAAEVGQLAAELIIELTDKDRPVRKKARRHTIEVVNCMRESTRKRTRTQRRSRR